MPIPKIIKDIYWKLPFLSAEQKEAFFYEVKKIIRNEGVTAFEHGSGLAEYYAVSDPPNMHVRATRYAI